MRRRASFFPLVIALAVFAFGLFRFVGAPDTGDTVRPDLRGPLRDARRPQPRGDFKPWQPGPGTGRPLPPPSERDPAVLVEVPAEKRSSTGTAFAIDDRGTWMTARHVVDSCQRLYVLTSARRGMRVSSVYVHPRADVAIIRTNKGAPAVRFSDRALSVGQDGYQFGYPAGKPGDVSSRLIGRRVMRVVGRYRTSEPVIAWAEQVRIPDTFGGLGGISGGPAFNAAGNIVGVAVAGSKRRGRIFTAAPVSVRNALAKAGVTPDSASAASRAAITNSNFADYGTRLRRQLTVSKVVCVANGQRRSNPRRPAAGGGGPRR